MAMWVCVCDGEVLGPMPEEEMLVRIRKGSIGPQSRAHVVGSEDWATVCDIEVFREEAAKHLQPAEPEPAEMPLVAGQMPAGAWRRYLARRLDILVAYALLKCVPGLFALLVPVALMRMLVGHWIVVLLLFFAITLPVALLVDALLYRLFGATPGKALLGIVVRSADGTPLGARQYLRRNVSVWWRGLGCGVPLVDLGVALHQAHRLDKKRPASYDGDRGYQVTAGPIGIWRWVALFILLLVLGGGASRADGIFPEGTGAGGDSQVKATSWINPATQKSVMLASGWISQSSVNATGQPIYRFVNPVESVTLLAIREEAPQYALSQYVALLEASGRAGGLKIQGKGQYENQDWGSTWDGDAQLAARPQSAIHVRIVQKGDAFWRMTLEQQKPAPAAARSGQQLMDALCTTF